jgi:hypothetical protein
LSARIDVQWTIIDLATDCQKTDHPQFLSSKNKPAKEMKWPLNER